MESKLNTLAIKTYCSAFTDRVANDFFAKHEKINGEQIIKLSPVQQVNLFVIKNLFENWQQEASRLRSPYFNYSHPKVQEAQKVYMNTLSRHIAINETDFKPLLHKAVHDALVLLFVPGEYIFNALQKSSGQPQEVVEILKYARINQAYVKEAQHILNRQDVTDAQWLKALSEALKTKESRGELQPENPTPYLQQFAEVLPLHAAEIVLDKGLESTDADEETDFFSSITSSLREEEVDRPRGGQVAEEPPSRRNAIEQSQSAPAPDENLPTVSGTAPRHAHFRREEPEPRTKTPEIQISRPTPETENRQRILNDTFGKEKKSLNEKLTAPAENKSLAAAQVRKKKRKHSFSHQFKPALYVYKRVV